MNVYNVFPNPPGGETPSALSPLYPLPIQLLFQQCMQCLLRFNLRAVEVKRKAGERCDPDDLFLEAEALAVETCRNMKEQNFILKSMLNFSDRALVSAQTAAITRGLRRGIILASTNVRYSVDGAQEIMSCRELWLKDAGR